MEIQNLLNSNRKKTVECVIPTGSDPLPDEEILLSLKQACPDAAFFTLIPPIGEDSGEPTVPQKTQDYFPRTLTSFHSDENKNASDQELDEKTVQFLTYYGCTEEQIDNLFQRTKNQNISELWYEHRKGRITGTKAHDILVRRDSTPPENLVMKIMDYKTYDLSKKEAVKWGLDNESKVRQAYFQNNRKYHRNLKCEQSGFKICKSNVFFGATADGIVSCECCGPGTLEIKCPFKHRQATLLEAALTDSAFCLDQNMNIKQNHRYYTQVQFQMAVFDTQYTDFVVMTEPNSEMTLGVIRVFRNNQFCEELFRRCSLFFQKYVVPELLTKKLMDKPLSDESTVTSDRVDMPKWCLCGEPEYGKMIICDNDACGIGWFHYPCVNVKRKPRGRWFCPNCKK